ncbi:MAG TPA: hypothetical protein VGR71_01490 [Nitrospira sp.]|nr:hypothetical protein [Nitrospira sp.]
MDLTLSKSAMRRALELMEGGGHETLDELIEELIVERTAREVGEREAPDVVGTELMPDAATAPEFAEPAPSPRGTLLFLTNRLSPIKVATRVLAGLSKTGSWPTVEQFQDRAAGVAREVGLRLREEGRQDMSAQTRRWIGYPIGEDVDGSLRRFVFSFAIDLDPGGAAGPMWMLGLANQISGSRVALTEAGWRLASAHSPILDGGEGTLGDDEAAILREGVASLPDELAASLEFLELVRRSGGAQSRLDGLLSVRHADWTGNRAIAERGAFLGRLGELGLVAVKGRGKTARIEVTGLGRRFETEHVREKE